MASTRSIQVTCEYLQDPPEVYSVQLTGNQTKKEDIVKQLSDSLSSANLNSYIIDLISQTKLLFVQVMKDSWYYINSLSSFPECLTQLLQDAHEVLQQLQRQIDYLKEKDEQRDKREEKMLVMEVFSRIAQGM